LRKQQTSGELAFWEIVRRKQILGKRFLRQYVLEYQHEGNKHFFIVDFYCAEEGLVVEVNGGIHEKQVESDFCKRKKHLFP
jgi:very-short-patch-repair endonuclease